MKEEIPIGQHAAALKGKPLYHCPSCLSPYASHLGVVGQCRKIRELKEELGELKDELRLLKAIEINYLGLLERLGEFRDCVLNDRHELEQPCLDGDQTNSVLALFDRVIVEGAT